MLSCTFLKAGKPREDSSILIKVLNKHARDSLMQKEHNMSVIVLKLSNHEHYKLRPHF